ncbi:MAG TPA: prolipoprotein diacylglyceryl transferase [Candidatus Acidoferrales bacterium]|nr:prolipoprotein diacylglyceryl transferase [Candidatus Acidoferrales bacterium]
MFPRLFSVGDVFTLHTYGLMVALGLLIGIYTAGRFAPRIGVEPETVWNLGIYMALAGLVGAKLALVFSEWGYYSSNPREIFSAATLHAGGVWHGGLLLAIATGAWYTWRHRLAFAALGDVYAPGIALGHALGRLGCFSAGCCWGKPTDVPWAVTFTNPYSAQLVGVPLGIALHPTQLYEAAAEAVIFGLLVLLWRRRSFSGQIFASYLMFYAVGRFLIEFFRGDPRGGTFFDGALSLPQVASVALLVVAGLFWLYQRHRAAPADAD